MVLPEAGHVASISGDSILLLWDYSHSTVLRRFSHTEEYSCLSYRWARSQHIMLMLVEACTCGTLLSYTWHTFRSVQVRKGGSRLSLHFWRVLCHRVYPKGKGNDWLYSKLPQNQLRMHKSTYPSLVGNYYQLYPVKQGLVHEGLCTTSIPIA